jgi:hypothetical protein
MPPRCRVRLDDNNLRTWHAGRRERASSCRSSPCRIALGRTASLPQTGDVPDRGGGQLPQIVQALAGRRRVPPLLGGERQHFMTAVDSRLAPRFDESTPTMVRSVAANKRKITTPGRDAQDRRDSTPSRLWPTISVRSPLASAGGAVRASPAKALPPDGWVPGRYEYSRAERWPADRRGCQDFVRTSGPPQLGRGPRGQR